VTGRAVGSGRVALSDGDCHGHRRRRGGGNVLILSRGIGHDQREAGGQDGEDALELHFE